MMYDALVAFIGTPPEGCEPFLYIACVYFTLFLVSEFYSFFRMFVMRLISHGGS